MGKIAPDHRLVALFCTLAAIRVLIYCAAFPFFNNVDESMHFDLVMKYGQGHIPRSLETMSPDSAAYIALFATPEYLRKPGDFRANRIPLPLARDYDGLVTGWSSRVNYESLEPPGYYAVAGIWENLGSFLGLNGGWILYWIRFLNVFLAAALVWIAYLAASEVFPENRFIVLGVPLLAAILPQDTYYSIQSDVLSPLCFGIVFVSMARFIRADVPSLERAVLTGLALAATTLVKSSNLPVLAVAMVAVLFKMHRLRRARKLSPAAVPIGMFALCALAPVFGWFAWNLSTQGDLTATAAKIQMFGWTHKPWYAWFHHPIFTPGGAWIFWSELMASFWRGEFVWWGARLAMPAADAFYWGSSLVFVALATIGLRRETDDFRRQMSWFAFGSFAALVIFMGLLSVSFDFGRCFYPSQQHPYFTSGRLVSAALIPFLLLYVRGLDRAISWIKSERSRFCILAVIALFVTGSEIIINQPAFASRYNLFHLLR